MVPASRCWLRDGRTGEHIETLVAVALEHAGAVCDIVVSAESLHAGQQREDEGEGGEHCGGGRKVGGG